MASLVNDYLTGTTTVPAIKTFWPNVSQYIPSNVINVALEAYIRRSEILINLFGPFDLTLPSFSDANIELIANMLVRRLVWSDNHPATSGDAAGVKQEAVKGVSYTLSGSRTLEQIVGDEIALMLQSVSDSTTFFASRSTQIFTPPVMSFNSDGDRVQLFDLSLDDILEPSIAQQLRIRKIPALELPERFSPFDKLEGPF